MGNSHKGNKGGGHHHNNTAPSPKKDDIKPPPKFEVIKNHYESVEQVTEALQKAGLESSNLIIGIDYTASNKSAGKKTFHGRSLHSISDTKNPYQEVIDILSRTLESFDEDKLIPVYGFGDKKTTDKNVFPFYNDERPCNGVQEALQRYNEITPGIELAGPTSFAPIINKAIEIVEREKSYHILVIVADGQITNDSEYTKATTQTTNAIVKASKYPISIIVVGVGDGPWEQMEEYDDQLPQRKFDNFQFVDFAKEAVGAPQFREANFALAALQELPEQYHYIKELGYLSQ
eukprot:TRINITY_DN2437_c0_g1_i1.p1 TRINITY_DN2437_c0_g1~~TRINITY_DN2437_c0_g1_i1.p1  ORF type:complete len:290 (+),score=78.76 TRINITY_DN2437_c0_g1_i1:57-926(+)